MAAMRSGRAGRQTGAATLPLNSDRVWPSLRHGSTGSRPGVSECLAYAWDLETNFRDEKRFQVKHWRDTRSGGYAIKEERDIYELIANMGARRKRACLLAVIPGDVQDAAVKQCHVTLTTKAEVTPERIKAMLELFAQYNVTKEQIEKRIQRRLDSITPSLFVQLGKIANSLRDGMSKPEEWFEPEASAGGNGRHPLARRRRRRGRETGAARAREQADR